MARGETRSSTLSTDKQRATSTAWATLLSDAVSYCFCLSLQARSLEKLNYHSEYVHVRL